MIAANKLGITQGAVCQMLKKHREIYVVIDGNGNAKGYEIRPIGATRKTA